MVSIARNKVAIRKTSRPRIQGRGRLFFIESGFLLLRPTVHANGRLTPWYADADFGHKDTQADSTVPRPRRAPPVPGTSISGGPRNALLSKKSFDFTCCCRI